MNEIVSKFLIAGDESIHEMHLRQPGFMYSACGPFTKNKKRIQKFKETGDSQYIYPQSQEKRWAEIWAVKLRFLLIYENMLKSIATARSECTAKHENKTSHNTDYIVSDLTEFFGDD